MPERHLRLFILFLVGSVFLMTYQSKSGPLRPFAFLSYPLYVINRAADYAATRIGDSYRMVALQERQLAEMKTKLDETRLNTAEYLAALEENRRLRGLLSLSERRSSVVAAARVVSRGNDRWSNVLVIDKGSGDIVSKDMAVITPEGLLGKVLEAGEGFSTVLLIDDNRFSAAVRLESCRAEAILRGGGRARAVLKYLSIDQSPSMGETVVTSGLDSLFPANIPAGYVSKIETDERKLFHEVEVTTFVEPTKVEEVLVIK